MNEPDNASPDNASPDNALRVTLRDGTPALVRPIRADGGAKLAEALRHLSPDARYHRFLFPKSEFSEPELSYLTHCDGVNHLALVLVITDAKGNEIEPVAVARCVRDEDQCDVAEAAIVVADAWQRRGAGKILLQALAECALAVGIRRWQATLLADNRAALKLMEHVGSKESERMIGTGVIEILYRLND